MKSEYKLILGDCWDVLKGIRNGVVLSKRIDKFDLIYADMIYDDFKFGWTKLCQQVLKDTGSIFVQTDYRSVAELKIYLDKVYGKNNLINWIIWPYDWGGRSKRAFGRKHDDILWYSRSKNYKFYPERIAIPKRTAKTGFNKSGRNWKIPTDVWEDIGNFHTMSKERLKLNGHNIPWQKPERLLERIILATTDPGDSILDPFMGTGTTGVVAIRNERNFIGIEKDETIYNVAVERMKNEA